MGLRVGSYVCCALLAATLALGAARASAEETLRVALSDLPPLAMVDSAGNVSGLTFELTQAILAEAGYAADYRIEPHARTVHSLVNGQVDVILLFPNDQLRGASIAVGPVDPMRMIVLPGLASPCASVRDLYGKTVAALRGTGLDPQLSNEPRISIHWANSYNSALEMLRAGRVDAVTGGDLTLFHALRSNGMRPEEFGNPFTLRLKTGWLFARRDLGDDKVGRLREAIERLQAEGVLAGIRKAYTW